MQVFHDRFQAELGWNILTVLGSGYSLFWQEHGIDYGTYFGVLYWERGKKQKLHVLGI